MSEHRWDVIEVEIKAPHRIRIIDTDKGERDADAVIKMAVMRRGVEHHFFTKRPAGTCKDGDCLPQRS